VDWDLIRQDLRYSVRSLWRARVFTATAVLVTALGVGANTAAFSVADFVLVRPLPYPEPDTLVRLCEGPRRGGGWGCNNQLSPANYRDLKAMSSSFRALGAYANGTANLVGGGEPRRLAIASVTADVLPLFNVPPALGRTFDTAAGDLNAAVISFGLWQSQFGGDPAILGKSANLNGAPHVIVGVMPRGFAFPSRDVQLWTRLTLREEDFENRNNSYLEAVGRLRPGMTFEQADAELRRLADQLATQHPDTNRETGVSFFRMRDTMAPRYRHMLLTLIGASLCLLLLTSANLASLFLARAASQTREMALRAALGAGRHRLVRQLATESAAIAAAGGALGVLIAWWSLPVFAALVPPTLPLDATPGLDWRLLVVAGASAMSTAITVGILPARRAARAEFSALRVAPGADRAPRQRVRHGLVTFELAASVVLLVAAGLLVRAVWRVQSVDPGFVPTNVLTVKTALPRPKYDSPARRADFYEQVLTRVRALPTVEGAAFTSGLPLVVTGLVTDVIVAGRSADLAGDSPVSHRWVTDEYFSTMGIPIRRGRDLAAGDTAASRWVAVVSQSFADRYWPGQDPIGRVFTHRGRERAVVGVVGDVRVRGLERSSEPQIYLPAAQAAETMPSGFDPRDLVIRHGGSSEPLVAAIRQIVHAVDPDQPLSDIRALTDVVAGETAPRRVQAQVLGALALVAILLTGVGVYGLLSYTVSQRSREIGVRLALGADTRRIGRMVVVDGLQLAAVGIGSGVVVAYWIAKSMSALLFGIAPGDPATFAAAGGVVLLTALAGSVAPAFRAIRVSPMSALRGD
jgi:predicted permease